MPSPAAAAPPPSDTLIESTKRPPEQPQAVSRSNTVLNSTSPVRCVSAAGVSCTRSPGVPGAPPATTAAPKRSVYGSGGHPFPLLKLPLPGVAEMAATATGTALALHTLGGGGVAGGGGGGSAGSGVAPGPSTRTSNSVLAKAHGAPAQAVGPPALLQVMLIFTWLATRGAGAITWRAATGAITSGAPPGHERLTQAPQLRVPTT